MAIPSANERKPVIQAASGVPGYYYVNLTALDGPEYYEVAKTVVISAEALQKLKTILAAI